MVVPSQKVPSPASGSILGQFFLLLFSSFFYYFPFLVGKELSHNLRSLHVLAETFYVICFQECIEPCISLTETKVLEELSDDSLHPDVVLDGRNGFSFRVFYACLHLTLEYQRLLEALRQSSHVFWETMVLCLPLVSLLFCILSSILLIVNPLLRKFEKLFLYAIEEFQSCCYWNHAPCLSL